MKANLFESLGIAGVPRHTHERGYPMRRFVDRAGPYVPRHGDWQRPLHVWLYRSAWRVICFPCMTTLQSLDHMRTGGWATQGEAFDAALKHCQECPNHSTEIS